MPTPENVTGRAQIQGVEQATAAPGEKRNTRRLRKKKVVVKDQATANETESTK